MLEHLALTKFLAELEKLGADKIIGEIEKTLCQQNDWRN
jgi:hypothetical protein